MPIGFQSKKFVVDSKSYETTLLPATQGRGLYLRLIKALAPALEKLEAKDLSSGDESVFLRVVGAVLASLDGSLFEDLCDAFSRQTYDVTSPSARVLLGDPAVFDLHFQGRYAALLKWLLECLKANNFHDFLSAISPGAPSAAEG